jgi:hypothetical protein
MTQTEWARQTDEMRQPWDDMQGRKGSSHCSIGFGAGSRIQISSSGVSTAMTPEMGTGGDSAC